MADHDLKVWPQFFDALDSGDKSFEVRKDDRGVAVGDTLLLREWHPADMEYTGRTTTRLVTYIMRGQRAEDMGLKPGFAVFGVRP